MEEEEELESLRKVKQDLLKKANGLMEKLKSQEAEERPLSIDLKLLASDAFKSDVPRAKDASERKLQKQRRKLCEVSRQVSGVGFENVDRKWLQGDTYYYTCAVVSKALRFFLELTVDVKNPQEFEICDITCHFVNLNECYLLEIEPWIQTITRMKNFSLLVSTISQYSEQSIFRSKLLRKLEVEKYANVEECTEEKGGVLLRVKSSKDSKVYLKFHWSIVFLERTWSTEHFFVINPTDPGMDFAEENKGLLKNFCKKSLSKETLLDLWSKLCSALDRFHPQNPPD